MFFSIIILSERSVHIMPEVQYRCICNKCGRTYEVSAGESLPDCCGEIMAIEPLPPCTVADHPEMTRNSDDSNACDDSRGKES